MRKHTAANNVLYKLGEYAFYQLAPLAELQGCSPLVAEVCLRSISPAEGVITLDSELTLGQGPDPCGGLTPDGNRDGGREDPGTNNVQTKRPRRSLSHFNNPAFSDCRVLLRDGSSLHGHRCELGCGCCAALS